MFDFGGLNVRLLDGGSTVDVQRWDDFVFLNEDAAFFHRAGWLHILENIFHHRAYFLYAELDDKIVGVLPLAHVKSWMFGNSLVGLPFSVYGGPVGVVPEVLVALENAAKKLALELRVDYLEFRQRKNSQPGWGVQDIYVTFRKKICVDEDDNLRAIPRKQRAMVRKGVNRSLSSVFGSDIKCFFDLYADNMLRHGSPALPQCYFEELHRIFGSDCQILIIYSADGKAVSGVLSFYFKNEVLPYYAGDHLLARDLAANDFKYWELMRHAGARGIEVFDFGRSKRGTGSFAFKKNWGFEAEPLYYVYDLYRRNAVPQNNPLNKKYRWFISAWRHLPVGVAGWLGPKIVRSLG